jgi:GAF domain-containing protein
MEAHSADPSWHAYVAHLVEKRSAVFEPSSAAALGATLVPALGVKAVIILPLLVPGGLPLGILGVLRIGSAPYSLDELELAQSVARCTARALTRAHAS